MSDNKNNIEIGVKTTLDPSGLQNAKDGLDSLGNKVDELREKTVDLSEEEARLDDLRERARKLMDEANTQEAQAADVRQIKQVQYAQAVENVARGMTQAAAAVREFAENAKGADPELDKKLKGTATALDAVGTAATGAAMGFAVGGPMGAVVGGAAAVAFKVLTEEIEGLGKSLKALSEANAFNASFGERVLKIQTAMDMKKSAESWKDLKEEIELTKIQAEGMQTILDAQLESNIALAKSRLELAKLGRGGSVKDAQAELEAVQREKRDVGIARPYNQAKAEVDRLEELRMRKESQANFAIGPEKDKLEDELNQLVNAVQAARIKLDSVTTETNLKQADTYMADNVAGISTLQNELTTAGEQAGQQLATQMADIIRSLGDVGQLREVQEAKAQFLALAKDGIQANERDEATLLINQLFSKLRENSRETHMQYVRILQSVDASISLHSFTNAKIKQIEQDIESLKAALAQKGP